MEKTEIDGTGSMGKLACTALLQGQALRSRSSYVQCSIAACGRFQMAKHTKCCLQRARWLLDVSVEVLSGCCL